MVQFLEQSNNNDYMDMVNILSLVIDLMNLNENLTQNDKQEIINGLQNSTKLLLTTLNQHLELQDRKIDRILEILENYKLDKN